MVFVTALIITTLLTTVTSQGVQHQNKKSYFNSSIVSSISNQQQAKDKNTKNLSVAPEVNYTLDSASRDNLRQELRRKLLNSLSYPNMIVQSSIVSVSKVLNTNTGPSTVIAITPANNVSNPVPIPAGSNSFETAKALASTIGTIYAQKQNQIISQAKQQSQMQSQTRSIQNVFLRLPQPQELDQIIMTADSFPMTKTVQSVAESNLTCEQKISYLSDFYGRVQVAICMKNYTLSKLNIIIENSKAEVKRLNFQITQKNQSLRYLGLDDLRNQLNTGVQQLTNAYKIFNSLEATTVPKRAAINVSKSKIADITQKADVTRQQIPKKRLELIDINRNIAKLEQQLKDAKAKKSVVEGYITNLEKDVKDAQQKIIDEQRIIQSGQAQLQRMYDDSDRAKTRYKVLEIEVERKRTQISQKQKKFEEVQVQIQDLQARLSIEAKRTDPTQQIKLQNLIKELKNISPAVLQKVDEVNYRCNQVKQIQTINLRYGSTILYLLTPRDFNTYLQSSYYITNDIPNLKPIKLSIMTVHIADSTWQDRYGNPYLSDSLYNSTQFAFNGEFNCLNPADLTTGQGTIVNINSKYIQVQNQSKRFLLNLGACSRVESTQNMPLPGLKIYFRGKKVGQLQFNVYKATCF